MRPALLQVAVRPYRNEPSHGHFIGPESFDFLLVQSVGVGNKDQ